MQMYFCMKTWHLIIYYGYYKEAFSKAIFHSFKIVQITKIIWQYEFVDFVQYFYECQNSWSVRCSKASRKKSLSLKSLRSRIRRRFYNLVLTVLYSAGPTGLCEPVALAHWATEAYVHEALGVLVQRCTARQHEAYPSAQQTAGTRKYSPAKK